MKNVRVLGCCVGLLGAAWVLQACSGKSSGDGEGSSTSSSGSQAASSSTGGASGGQQSSSGTLSSGGGSNGGASGGSHTASGGSNGGASSGLVSSGGTSGNISSGGASGGASSGSPCPTAGELVCNGACINPLTDPEFCGATGDCSTVATGGEQCLGGKSCVNGHCLTTCPPGKVFCAAAGATGACISPNTNAQFCGAQEDCMGPNAGRPCTNGSTCTGGMCTTSCTGTDIACGGGLVSAATATLAPANFTASMGTVAFVAANQGATFAVTVSNTPPGSHAVTIHDGTDCTNTSTSAFYASMGVMTVAAAGTGTLAGSGPFGISIGATVIGKSVVIHADATDTGTRIACGAITLNATMTSAPAQCVNGATDAIWCGATLDCASGHTGVTCAPDQACSGGTCAACNPGEIKCNGVCTNPASDNAHCGATLGCGAGSPAVGSAGTVCDSLHSCQGGTCRPLCPPGQISCGTPATCVDPRTDNMYCGANGGCTPATSEVGTACATGTACNGDGTCTRHCLPGYVLCGNTCIDPYSNNTFCGASLDCTGANDGTVCASGTQCSDGTCGTTCATGYVPVGGVCYLITDDPRYCGAGGVACPLGQECYVGTCRPSTRTFVGALTKTLGHWAYQVGALPEIGYSAGLHACGYHYGQVTGSPSRPMGICTDAQLRLAETRGDLSGATDYANNLVTTFWVDNPTARLAAPAAGAASAARNSVCFSNSGNGGTPQQTNPNNEAWTYGTADQGYSGAWSDLDNPLGDLLTLNTPTSNAAGVGCNSQRFVGCCLQ